MIINVGKDESGTGIAIDHVPERVAARLYPADDPTIRHLRRDPAQYAAQTAPPGGELALRICALRRVPIGGAGVGAEDSPRLNDDTAVVSTTEVELAPTSRSADCVTARRPDAADLLERQGALLTRGDLAALGLTRTMVDAVFRELPVVVFPGSRRPAVKREDYLELLERCTYRDDRVRPTRAPGG